MPAIGKHMNSLRTSNSTTRNKYSLRNAYICTPYKNVHRSYIHNNSKPETTLRSFNSFMDKSIVLFSHNGSQRSDDT